MSTRLLRHLVLSLGLIASAAQADEPAAPSLQRLSLPATAQRPALTMFWAPVDAERRPVVLALHGCVGLYRRDGRTLDPGFYPAYAARLQAMGVHVLLVDSFGSRGEGSICEQPYAQRKISLEDRRGDVLAALDWLRQRPEADLQRLGLIGWSNGASTVLALLDPQRRPAVPLPLAAAMMFYPSCDADAMQRIEPSAGTALLMQLGGADDWTLAAPCERLARRWSAAGLTVQLDTYPGAYHGFDSTRPLRHRGDVPNGSAGSDSGVHQGRDEAAAEASAARLQAFVRQHLRGGGEVASASTQSARTLP